jgi:hypothetical protein
MPQFDLPSGFEAQIGSYQHRLDHLLRDGRDLHRSLRAPDRDFARDLDAMRLWQRECAATISQLSGGSKQHWLSRAYSDAFLPRVSESTTPLDGPVEEVPVDLIVDRIIGVLREAQASLAGMKSAGPALQPAAPGPRRFGFVRDAALRPQLEQAFVEAEAAFGRGEFSLALVTWASVLEAILTDALADARAKSGDIDRAALATWTFAARIAEAERMRLISGGCTRLPHAARHYRELLDEVGDVRPGASVSESDAKITGQVLRLIMRDLVPGR